MSRNNKEYQFGQYKRKPKGGPGGHAMGGGEKPKNFKDGWGKLLGHAKSYRPAMLLAVVCAALGTIFTLMGPSRLSRITDLITEGMRGTIDLPAVEKIAITLVVLYGLSLLLSLSQGLIMATVTQRVSKSLRKAISEKINRLPMYYYNKHTVGDVLSRVTNDVDTISQSMNQSISAMVTSTAMLVGSLLLMLSTNLIMTMTAVIATVIGFTLMAIIMSKSQKYFTRQQEHLGQVNGHVEEIYAGHTVVKAYNGEGDAKAIFDQMNQDLRKSSFRAQSFSGLMMPIMAFVGNLGYVAICIVGALLNMKGYISFGVIVAFMMYVRFFTQPLSQIAQANQAMQSAAAASERVFEFLAEEEMEDESHKTAKIEKAQGYVDFYHVTFGYEGTDKIVINDFTAHAKPGQKIAIVGPTGAGKTTIINLLMGFHKIHKGDIRIDGTSIYDLTRENLRDQFCMVLQDTWLFEATIRENLVYCTPDVTDDQVIKACKSVGIDHFIHTLPKGYDTVLNQHTNLSQGQKQQLTIARAMIAAKPMLILDEATSSVDTRTELLIQEAMDQLMENRTSFIIAHRLSTIRNADLILVMDQGDIIESGTHQDLLEKKGFYADLYNSQFEQDIE